MTDKQVNSAKKKIEKYKKALAADKKFWSGQYHDGGGIRYFIPQQFIKIQDYKGGLRYLRWFEKNFPEDSGVPMFLFEWTFILFKCSKLKEAERKAYQTFLSNSYLFDKFLGKELLLLNDRENPNWELVSLENKFPYNKTDHEFVEFASWIENVLGHETFFRQSKRSP